MYRLTAYQYYLVPHVLALLWLSGHIYSELLFTPLKLYLAHGMVIELCLIQASWVSTANSPLMIMEMDRFTAT